MDERAFWEEWTADGEKGACNWRCLGVVRVGEREVRGAQGTRSQGKTY